MSSKSLRIRIASLADAAALVALVNGAYRGASGRKGWTTEADILDGQRIDLEMMKELLARQSGVMLVAEQESMVGCVRVDLYEKSCAHLGMLTVHVDQQKRGIGDLLVSAAENFAKKEFAKVFQSLKT